MAAPKDDLIVFRICSQEFRLRCTPEEAPRVERVARQVETMVRENRERGATSELRAVMMAAFQFARELDEIRSGIEERRATADRTIDATRSTIDRLLSRLDAEMGARVEKDAEDPGAARRTARKRDDTQDLFIDGAPPQAQEPPADGDA